MSEFTYERENTNNALETYEWDNVWWDHAPDLTTPRVLAIGDSISCGWRHVLTAKFEGKAWVDGFGTSKAVDNPYFFDSVCLFAKQMPHQQTVLFNNGLHGFHLSTAEYRENYEQLIVKLLKEFPQSRFFIVLTTPARRTDDLTQFDARTELVKARNAAAIEIAEKYALPVIDLFTPLASAPELFSHDGVHLNADGYGLLADIIKAAIA